MPLFLIMIILSNNFESAPFRKMFEGKKKKKSADIYV